MFCPYSITINKCKGSGNTINDPYAKLCVPDTVKNIYIKIFNLMARTNETRHMEWHKTCKCKCRLDASDNLCDIGEYLDYKKWKCKKRFNDKLVEECSKNIDGNKMLHNETLNVDPIKCL